jgi:hypothetical protein
VVVLCVIDLMYAIPDVLFSMDSVAPPIYFIIKDPSWRRGFTLVIKYNVLREVRSRI